MLDCLFGSSTSSYLCFLWFKRLLKFLAILYDLIILHQVFIGFLTYINHVDMSCIYFQFLPKLQDQHCYQHILYQQLWFLQKFIWRQIKHNSMISIRFVIVRMSLYKIEYRYSCCGSVIWSVSFHFYRYRSLP